MEHENGKFLDSDDESLSHSQHDNENENRRKWIKNAQISFCGLCLVLGLTFVYFAYLVNCDTRNGTFFCGRHKLTLSKNLTVCEPPLDCGVTFKGANDTRHAATFPRVDLTAPLNLKASPPFLYQMMFVFGTNATDADLNPEYSSSASSGYKHLVLSNGKMSSVIARGRGSRLLPNFQVLTVFVTNTDDYNQMTFSNQFKMEYVTVLVSQSTFDFAGRIQLREQLCDKWAIIHRRSVEINRAINNETTIVSNQSSCALITEPAPHDHHDNINELIIESDPFTGDQQLEIDFRIGNYSCMTIYMVDEMHKAMNTSHVTVARVHHTKAGINTWHQHIECDTITNVTCKVLLQFTNYHYTFDRMDTSNYEIAEIRQVKRATKSDNAFVELDQLNCHFDDQFCATWSDPGWIDEVNAGNASVKCDFNYDSLNSFLKPPNKNSCYFQNMSKWKTAMLELDEFTCSTRPKRSALHTLGDAGTRQRELHSRQFNSYHSQTCRVDLTYAWYDDIRQHETAVGIGELRMSLASVDAFFPLENVTRSVSDDDGSSQCIHDVITFTIEPLVTHHLVLQILDDSAGTLVLGDIVVACHDHFVGFFYGFAHE